MLKLAPWCVAAAVALSGIVASGQAPVDSTAVYGQAILQRWTAAAYPKDLVKEGLYGQVSLRLAVGADGTVTSSRVLDASDPRLVGPAQEAAKQWTFSPALDAGKPVACSMDALISFSPEEATNRRRQSSARPPEAEVPVPAAVTEAALQSTPDIDYPESLFGRRLSGKAHYACHVAPDGSISHLKITAATHVDFVVPALAALRELKYSPRMQGDVPMGADVDGILRFDLTQGSAGGALAANGFSGPDGQPPAADVEPFVVVDPVYPFDALVRGTRGSATVLFTVDAKGNPANVRVGAADDPDFGKALVAATEMSVFTPPSADGHPAAVPLMRKVDFPMVPATPSDEADPLVALLADFQAGKIGGGKGLDGPLTPVYSAAPAYPARLRPLGFPGGDAVIQFVIDKDGRVRLPRVVSATNEDFGWAAATAAAQWVFEVPRHNGRAVPVKVQVPFHFKSPGA
jgi:TonB family protein